MNDDPTDLEVKVSDIKKKDDGLNWDGAICVYMEVRRLYVMS